MFSFDCTDYSSGKAIVQRVSIVGSKRNKWRVHFIGFNHNYSYDCDQWSDVVELLEVYNFGGFSYEKES